MKRLILVNGFPGAGKTTISRKLYEELNDGALIDTDHLMHGRPWEADRIFPIALKNGLAAARNFYDSGFDTVILAGCVHTKELFSLVAEAFAGKCRILYVQLSIDERLRKERAADRRYQPLPILLSADDIPSVEYVNIDTGKHSTEEVVREIRRHL